jgi:hypothetical protein
MKARIIIPVWGAKYIKRLDFACLPALLASGNLPHLAEHYECELVIVTESALFDAVRELPGIKRAAAHACLRLVAVDDVLSFPAYYGLTITHALYRGFTDLGDAAKDVWCLFLNADFILADGSYRPLVKHMQSGVKCIFSPSYCTIEEDVWPALTQRAATGGGVLSVPPREMAGLILDHKHFSIRAKIINWKMYRIDRVDQFYCLVDNDTLVGRQLPIAVVAFRPERVPIEPVTFWDYGVVSEICPNGPMCVLGDSDDFLMLELRGRETMREQLSLGWMNPAEIARDLSIWTTKDQRDCGEFTLVLHRSDLPADYQRAVQTLETYYRDVMRRVAPVPRDYHNHYIWTGMLELHNNWLRSRRALSRPGVDDGKSAGASAQCPEIEPTSLPTLMLGLGKGLVLAACSRGTSSISRKLFDLIREVYLRIFGRLPDVGPLHPHFVDVRPALDWIKRFAAGRKLRGLGVWAIPGAPIAPFLDRWIEHVSSCRPNDILSDDGWADLKGQGPFDLCFVELSRDELLDFSRMHARLRTLVQKGGYIVVLYRTRGVEQVLERDFRLIANGMPECDFSELEIRGTKYSVYAQKLWETARKKAEAGGGINLMQLSIIAPTMLLLAAIGNRASRAADLGVFKKSCTSLLLKVKVV